MSNIELKEPQKPDSAYGLFFRDTQAAIKTENPHVTFEEVSSVVSSMWASLSDEGKKFYKVKTEKAKDKYIKLLAIYRANVSYKKSTDRGKSQGYISNGNKTSGKDFSGLTIDSATASKQTRIDQNLNLGVSNRIDSLPKPSDSTTFDLHKDSAFLKTSNVFDILSNDTLSSFSGKNDGGAQNTLVKPVSDEMHKNQVESNAQDLKNMNLTVDKNIISPKQFYSSKPIFEQPTRSILGAKNIEENSANRTMRKESSCDTCVRNGCFNPPTYNPRWNSDYCSNECVVAHCRNIFESFLTMRSLCPS